MSTYIRVLVVEDSSEDAFLIIRELQRGGYQVDFERVETRSAMAAALDRPWDIIMSDYSLPRFSVQEALALYLQRELITPFIVVSGAVGEERAVEVVKAGAHNYVMKDNLPRLVPVVEQEIANARERLIRRHAEATTAYLASVVQSSDDAIIGKTLEGTIVSWNLGAERLYGYTAAEMVGRPVSVLIPPYLPDLVAEIMTKIRRGDHVESIETVRLRKDGTSVEVSLTVSPVRDHAGKVIGASSIARDITRRKFEENERLSLIQDLTAALSHSAEITAQGSGARGSASS